MFNANGTTAEAADGRIGLRSTDRLLDTRALQRAIFNSPHFSSIATDAEGVIQIFNVGAERMMGYTAAEVMNKITPADISDPEELIARAKALSLELDTQITPGFEALVFKASRGIEDIYELTYIRKDRSRFAAVVSVTALRNDQDVIIGYLLISTDNTARKQFEEERQAIQRALQLKNVELEEASRMKSEFLANMSHELRTPLNAIIGFSEILRDGLMGDMTDQQRGFISDIFSSGQHLLSLINDILDLSKVEAGMMLLDVEPVPVSSWLRNSLSIVREKAAARSIHLTMDGDHDLGVIQADARKVKQIVYNLLSNAVKFTPDGGRVTMRARRVGRDSVGALSSAGTARTFPLVDNEFTEFLEISVSDTGIGIAPEDLQHLFKPFTQIDGGLARKFEGTGLGLAMVKLLVDLHGGVVAVESGLGEGSRFTIWLPARELEEAQSLAAITRAAREHDPVSGVRTALVVEADEKSAELIRVQLEAEGFQVVHATSVAEALEVATAQPLSLITLDIILRDEDGWEFLTSIKRMPKLASVPVVIISIVADLKKGFALGASAVVQKPITRKQLYESLVGLGLLPLREQALRILVVDDDPKSLELIAVRLKGLVTTILRAESGRAAIDIAREELPDLIVLDLMMPETNGFEVVEALSDRADTARIPILVVTAKEINAADSARLTGHVATIMEKTDFDVDRFRAEVRRATSKHTMVA